MHPHTDFAHRYWMAALTCGDMVVDATAGNGYDTAAIALGLGNAGGGTLLACDVQRSALDVAMPRVREALAAQGWRILSDSGTSPAPSDGVVIDEWVAHPSQATLSAEGSIAPCTGQLRVRWLHGSHVPLLASLAAMSTRLVVFNLGYLPGGDKRITTQAESTLEAVQCAQRTVVPGGAVSVTLYPGHKAGQLEADTLLEMAQELPQPTWSVYHTRWLNQKARKTRLPSPELLLLQRIHPDPLDEHRSIV